VRLGGGIGDPPKAVQIPLEKEWVYQMKMMGFQPRTSDVGKPILRAWLEMN
jgi:hypothetical protein